MASFLHRSLRFAVLGLMFLLAGTANLLCVSYDTDNDEDTPPITVELSIVAPSKKDVQVAAPQARTQTFRLHDEKPLVYEAASASPAIPTLLDQKAPELQVPLRT
jgi:hypothetical protein